MGGLSSSLKASKLSEGPVEVAHAACLKRILECCYFMLVRWLEMDFAQQCGPDCPLLTTSWHRHEASTEKIHTAVFTTNTVVVDINLHYPSNLTLQFEYAYKIHGWPAGEGGVLPRTPLRRVLLLFLRNRSPSTLHPKTALFGKHAMNVASLNLRLWTQS